MFFFGKYFWGKRKVVEEDLTLTDRVRRLEAQWSSLPYGLRKPTKVLGTAPATIVEPGASQAIRSDVPKEDFEKLQVYAHDKGWIK